MFAVHMALNPCQEIYVTSKITVTFLDMISLFLKVYRFRFGCKIARFKMEVSESPIFFWS